MRAFAGVVLAGGEGRRFGIPKAGAVLPDGRTFLAACSDCLRAAGAVPVVATLPPGAGVLGCGGFTPCPLPAPSLPMFESLRMALAAAALEALWEVVVVLPVDHPLVSAGTVRAIVAPEAPAVLPRYAGRKGHPVALSRAVAEGIVAGVLAGPTLRDVIRRVGWVEEEVADAAIHANCNTPQALAQAFRDLAER